MNISGWSHPATEIRKVQLLQPFCFCLYWYICQQKIIQIMTTKDQVHFSHCWQAWSMQATSSIKTLGAIGPRSLGLLMDLGIALEGNRASPNHQSTCSRGCQWQFSRGIVFLYWAVWALILPFLPCPYCILLALILIFCFCVGDCQTAYTPCIITFSHNYMLFNWCSCVRQSELCLKLWLCILNVVDWQEKMRMK